MGGPASLVRPDGARVAYDVAGDGPPVIFLHGITNRRQGWDPVTDLLAPSFTCIRVDFRGHGESSTAADYSMPALVADVRAVADELGVTEPAVVGSSFGAGAAAVYAATNPVRAVLCAEPPLLRFGDFAARVHARAEDLRGDGAMRAVLAIEHELGLEPYGDVAGFERRVLAFPPEVVRGFWDLQMTTPPAELTAASEALLPAIEAPLLSLHGSRPPADYAPWLSRLLPGAEVEVWEGMGHLLHLVDPARFAARVRTLLAAA